MKIPFLDLKAQYESIKPEINEAIQQVLDSCAFAGGPFVQAFEKQFAGFCGCDHCIGVGSGTEALWLALLALGVGPGDEVITVPNTFIATAEAISFCGADPVFVDIDEKTYTMDPEKLNEFLEENCRFKHLTNKDQSTNRPINQSTNRPIRAIIPVHIFGQMADMDPIMAIARKHGLYVIEDACQAHGAEYKGQPAGSIGDAGCFSFYPGKNLGAYGEAGAVTTNNADLGEKIAMLRDHGQTKKYYHKWIGWNGRMDGIQGAVLNVKLKYLSAWNQARREKAMMYNDLLSGIDSLVLPYVADDATHVYHVYAVRSQNRDALLEYLADENIYCGIHYPVPVHLQTAYSNMGAENNNLKVSERVASELLSLPMFPELTNEQQIRVGDKIQEFNLSQSAQRPQRVL
jgi:dTDP-4-amino-4,6-dideoxygalactose transaminase